MNALLSVPLMLYGRWPGPADLIPDGFRDAIIVLQKHITTTSTRFHKVTNAVEVILVICAVITIV